MFVLPLQQPSPSLLATPLGRRGMSACGAPTGRLSWRQVPSECYWKLPLPQLRMRPAARSSRRRSQWASCTSALWSVSHPLPPPAPPTPLSSPLHPHLRLHTETEGLCCCTVHALLFTSTRNAPSICGWTLSYRCSPAVSPHHARPSEHFECGCAWAYICVFLCAPDMHVQGVHQRCGYKVCVKHVVHKVCTRHVVYKVFTRCWYKVCIRTVIRGTVYCIRGIHQKCSAQGIRQTCV